MKPINRAERSGAFYTFLLFFAITIGVVVTVVVFAAKVPLNENIKLRSRMLTIQAEQDLSDSFRVQMNVVLNRFAMYDNKEMKPEIVHAQVKADINKLMNLIEIVPDSPKDQKSIYELAVHSLIELNNAKTALADPTARPIK